MTHANFRRLTVWLMLMLACLGVASAQETQRVYLSGHGKDDAVAWRFMCTTGALSGFWTNLLVPSNWDVKGFGHLTYKKDYSNAITECGLYEKDFTASPDWNNKRVFLVFEGAMTDTSAKLNGASVGPTHQGGFYRFKYEVTDKLKLGAENKLEVTVAKHSANESVNKAERLADYWVFGGIFRPVYLEVVPQQFVERVAIDARADGGFSMEVFLNGVTDADVVEAQIITMKDKAVGGVFSAPLERSAGLRPGANPSANTDEPGRRPALQLKTQTTSPKLWTAETPNLYRVEVRLKRGAKVLHEFTQRFGFRTFEVRDGDGLYLNGQKIILKGVNRHSAWPDSGRCLSETVHRLDISTIKEMNGNAVRMSHYPPDVEFLDLCDELGLYVLDELAGWHNYYDTPTGTKLVEEMVTRDVNHPCILFWDNGNEGGFNLTLDKLFGEFDPQQRRVLHPWAAFNGVNTAHYLAYSNAQIAATGAPMYYHAKENAELLNTNLPSVWIYMPTEFMHGLYDGGAGAGLEDYWNMMMSHTNCAGGFIWVFADEGIKRPDTGQMDVAGNQAPDGIVGPYRQREASFYAIKDIWSPIQVKREVPQEPGFLPMNSFPFSLKTKYSKDSVRVSVGDVAVTISTQSGLLSGVAVGRKQISLANGPRLVSGSAKLKSIQTTNDATGVRVTSLFDGDLEKVTWLIQSDKHVRCEYTYRAVGPQDVIGVVFDYPENLVKKKRWLGDGPYRVWKNRLRGVTFGEWENDYNNTITGYSGWKYPEFKGCFSNVRWLQLETTEGLITVVPENIPFVQVLTPEMPPTNFVAKTKVNLPQCGLGFLHAIPPIGTKFKDASSGGPQGQPNVGTGEYSGSVSFYFGKLPKSK